MERGKPSKEGVMYIADRSIVIMMLTAGLELVDTEKVEGRRGEGVWWFGFEEGEGKRMIEAIKRNKPIPIKDVRMVIIALQIFNTVVFGRID